MTVDNRQGDAEAAVLAGTGPPQCQSVPVPEPRETRIYVTSEFALKLLDTSLTNGFI